ncbi:RidA family protein [Dyadobacter psychrotolerans]|uniref:RidA family protein n=1 Tax=Dyadobacter psychrotolerans TaxID=2541721 RepID=A0A4V2Z2X5_9BACT|nr:RidA family protein [Dyadobacter psychrotolerans]TDE10538.1 RidA family protein [Dyadobacter psychrotolerans]
MEKKINIISTKNAAAPGGHYVQATEFQGLVYISGQLPVKADGSHTTGEPFEVQVKQSLENLLEILKAAGGSSADLLKVTVYLVGIENWPAFNRIYAEILGDVKPARSIVPVPELHYGYLIEIDAVAAVTTGKSE